MSSSDTPPGRDYEGPAGVARDSTWLTAADLPESDKDILVEIERVIIRDRVKFRPGQTKDNVISLKFKSRNLGDRELGLTAACNLNAMIGLYGKMCASWKGKRIYLYVDPNVSKPGSKDGEKCNAIRIRSKRPPTAAGPKAATTDEYADIPTEREPGSDDDKETQ